MLTNEQKKIAKEMLDNGSTYREVGEHFGLSRQRIHTLFPSSSRRARRKAGEYNYIYPNVNKFMKDNKNLSLMQMCRDVKISPNHLHRIFYGEVSPSKNVIDRLLNYTGMTYEEMFYKEVV